MKINWSVRIHNPVFWFHVALAIITPILSYFGLSGADLTTWGLFFDTLGKAVLNPFVMFTVAISVWNCINDPTTKGISDSPRAMNYIIPN